MTPLEQLTILFEEREGQLLDFKFYMGPSNNVALVDIAREVSQMLKAAANVEPSLKFDEEKDRDLSTAAQPS